IDILCDDRKVRNTGRHIGDCPMRRIGRAGKHERTPPLIPAPDEIRISLEGLGCGETLCVEILPESCQRITESRNTAFLRHPCPGEHNNVIRTAQGLDQRGVELHYAEAGAASSDTSSSVQASVS